MVVMAEIKRGTKKESDLSKIEMFKGLGVYVNLLTDFGFKRIFGNKELMLNFLNTVLNTEEEIVDLYYDNTERLGITDTDRKAIYDLICTTKSGERIIVEMQAVPQQYFKDRTLFYASYLIQDQNVKGKTWNFKLSSVYSINIANFFLEEDPDRPKGKYIYYVQLIDRDTNQLFYKKLTLVYIELPSFTKKLHKLKTFLDQWIYIIRHLPELESLPETLNNEIFAQLFKDAKIAKMTKKQKNEYFISLKNLSDMNIAKIELDSYRNQMNVANRQIDSYRNQLDVIRQIVIDKDRDIAERDARIAEREARIAEKEARIAELECKMSLN